MILRKTLDQKLTTLIAQAVIKKHQAIDYNINSMFLARARMNSLKLEEAIGRSNKRHDKRCRLCHQEIEDVNHFIMKCPKLEGKRDYNLINKKIKNSEKRLIELLYKQNKYQETGHMIRMLWNERLKILKSNEEDKNRKAARKGTGGKTDTRINRT